MTTKPIPGHVVKRCLRVSDYTLRLWRNTGFLAPASETRLCYHGTDLDILLATGARNFERTPIFADLATKKVRLLTPAEVADMLEVTRSSIYNLVKNGSLAAIKYSKGVRYCEESVKKYMHSRLTAKQVIAIFGFSKPTLHRLVAEGKLVREQLNSYAEESVITLLTELLPPHECPKEWLRNQRLATRPLRTIADAAPSIQDRKRIRALLEAGEMRYIHKPDKRQVLISPDSLLAYSKKYERCFDPEALARFFCVPDGWIDYWDRHFPAWRTCYLHAHADTLLYKSCIVRILGRYLRGGSPLAWYGHRLEAKGDVIEEAEAMRMLGVECPDEFGDVVREYGITHLLTPEDEALYLAHSVSEVRRKLCRAAWSK